MQGSLRLCNLGDEQHQLGLSLSPTNTPLRHRFCALCDATALLANDSVIVGAGDDAAFQSNRYEANNIPRTQKRAAP